MAPGDKGGGVAQIALLHLVSIYVPRMGLPASLWNEISFASKGDVTCGTIACKNWQTASLHQIRSMVHVLVDMAIDAVLALEPDA